MHPPTVVGGIFLATHNVPRLVKWYQELGMPLGADGSLTGDQGKTTGAPVLVFSIQTAKGELPGTGGDLREEPYGMQRLTLNLRVADLDEVLADLRKRDIAVAGPRDYGYGRFAWVKDPDGNLVELWQAAKA